MSRLREAACLEMRLRGFSPRTHESYLHAWEQLWAFYRRRLDRLSCQDVQRFLDETITMRPRASPPGCAHSPRKPPRPPQDAPPTAPFRSPPVAQI